MALAVELERLDTLKVQQEPYGAHARCGSVFAQLNIYVRPSSNVLFNKPGDGSGEGAATRVADAPVPSVLIEDTGSMYSSEHLDTRCEIQKKKADM
ncbi:hypothetical protein GQ464_010780 [Rhodocaloribacter litoris]|uniref:hypothetical protein n=1 Tax=Rhodocaloribacter litoris TaxID=2558931 RepID=UPI00141E4073|nr:hypothetical protein [Rhodocaloribacter litoris]QXD13942.1 hypothetical protein GQ464_010780 [Rhodocaloribacter litoris]